MAEGQLVPANQNGNPSFEYAVLLSTSSTSASFGHCQATCVGEGLLLTAAHCVEGKNGQTLTVRTADFGEFQAQAVVHPSYVANSREIGRSVDPRTGAISIQMSYAPHDIAILDAKGAACRRESRVPIVPISTEPLTPGTPIELASKWLRRILSGVAGAISDRARSAIAIHDTGIKQGDSGGGLFRLIDGVRHIVGVLSTGRGAGDSFSTEAGYATNDSVAWAAEEVRRRANERRTRAIEELYAVAPVMP